MKRSHVIAACVLVLALAAQALLAQTESAPKDQTKAPATEKAAGTKVDDSKFLNEAASGGLLEVRLGSFIQQSATDDSVKAFGQQMVTDHSKVNDELRALAAQSLAQSALTLEGKYEPAMVLIARDHFRAGRCSAARKISRALLNIDLYVSEQ